MALQFAKDVCQNQAELIRTVLGLKTGDVESGVQYVRAHEIIPTQKENPIEGIRHTAGLDLNIFNVLMNSQYSRNRLKK